jgi:diguanylate cyclase (GGDEF)-like protein
MTPPRTDSTKPTPQRPRRAETPPTVEDLARRLRKQEFDFTTIFEVATQINAHVLDDRHIESYLQFLSHYLTTLARGQFGVSKAYLFMQREMDANEIVSQGEIKGHAEPLTIAADSPLGERLLKASAPFLLDESEDDASLEKSLLRKLGVSLVVPLVMAGGQFGTNLKGMLALGPKLVGETFLPGEIRLLGLLANMTAVAVHNAQLHRKSIVDHLTQLYSRGHFDLHLASELSRAERYSRKELEPQRFVTLIMMDIDHFKSFNDTHGHQAGDRVLRAVSRTIQKAVRKSDLVARYGGEEFVLIAVETGKNDGVLLAERLRKQVAQTTVTVGGTARRVTASFGVSTYPGDARTPQELIAQADGALYRAKDGGRNQVCVAPPLEGGPNGDPARGETKS